jgi:hypothetical protein
LSASASFECAASGAVANGSVVAVALGTTTNASSTAPEAAHSNDAEADKVLAVQVTPSIEEFATFVLEDIPIKAVKSKSSMLVLSLAIIAAI